MIAVKPIYERRKDPRLDNNIPVKICREGGDLVAQTQNISRSGAYCCIEQPIPLMTKLKIHLLISCPEKGKKNTKKISCEGVVVRCEPSVEGQGHNVAIFFSDITKNDAKSITDYVNMCLKGQQEI